ncbi:vesicle coat component [Ascosphaera aggregata]|nr:vesicle coat component [Ascosphaera aggregata]
MSQQLSQQHQQPKYGLPLPSPSIYSPKSRHTPANSRDLSMASSTSAHQYTPTSYIPQTQTPSARTSLDSNAAATSTSRHFSMTLHGDQRSLSTASLQNASRADSRGRFIEASQLQEDAAGPSTNIESLVPTRSESIYRDTIESRKSTSPIVAADGETIASSSIHSQPDYMGYMPPTANSLSDSPALSTASVEEETLELKGKRRSYIMEDDEDDAELLRRAAALKESEEKRRSQVEQEKAKMTEKNAQQSSSQQKRGWFSGWFGGSTKKESTSPATVTRAKLGEENSFYYDKDLKRWVNRKDPGAATAATGTLPPPPKASGPLKREPRSGSTSPTPSLPASTGAPPVTAVGLGQTAVAASGKSTELKFSAKSAPTKSSDILPSSSNVASATDAASAPTMPRNIGDASSLDDLLNTPAPVPRVHTTRSKRKGRGYVDLMAK